MVSARLAAISLCAIVFFSSALATPFTSSNYRAGNISKKTSISAASSCDGVCVLDVLHKTHDSLAPVLASCKADSALSLSPARCIANVGDLIDVTTAKLRGATHRPEQVSQIATLLVTIVASILNVLSMFKPYLLNAVSLVDIDLSLMKFTYRVCGATRGTSPLVHSLMATRLGLFPTLGLKHTKTACGY